MKDLKDIHVYIYHILVQLTYLACLAAIETKFITVNDGGLNLGIAPNTAAVPGVIYSLTQNNMDLWLLVCSYSLSE